MPNLLGRRFRCEVCNTEVLITKAGEGAVECCGKPMTVQQPKPLPSSD
jgi:desulfoferrodoxin-like iron-binding protein